MNNKTKTIKIILSVIVVIIIILIIFQLLSSKSTLQDTTQTTTLPPERSLIANYPSQLNTFKEINLASGNTNINDFIIQNDQPLPSDSQYVSSDNKNDYFFPSSIPHLPIQVTTDQLGNITIIREINIDQKIHGLLNDYLNFYANPDLKLYGPWHRSGYHSYVWLKNGIIIIANSNLKQENIMEIWRITPLTKTEFYSQFGDQFFDSPQPLPKGSY